MTEQKKGASVMQDNLSAVKAKLLEMFKWFHDFCTENGLRYYAVGGTLLGAVRHGGFIPWDDDVDVAMPRSDYERLKALAKAHQDKRFRLEFPGDADDFVYTYGKVFDASTTLIENSRYKAKRGLFIDIFPLDGLGDTKEEALASFKKIDNTVKLFETKMCAVRKGRSFYKNAAVVLMHCVPDFILNPKRIFSKIERLSKAHDFDESVYVANCVGNWHEKEIALRSAFGTPTLYKFENMEIYGTEDADTYLGGVYGDWRKLPPEEKRVSHHDYIELDINKPYM